MRHYIHGLLIILSTAILAAPFSISMAATAQAVSVSGQPNMFSVINKFAQFSSVAYEDKDQMEQVSHKWGYKLSNAGQLENVGVRYFMATNKHDKTQIISIRGTANAENAAVNFELKLNRNNPAGISLHSGFAKAAVGVLGELRSDLKSNYDISLTGHSLGGGVAVILAMYLDTDDYKIDRVVTFGQPKVTNINGANRFSHLNILRVVTPKDMIPLLPPFDPVTVPHRGIYWHLGTEIVLLEGTDYSMLGGINSMLRATKFFKDRPDQDNLQNHEMSTYSQLVDQKIKAATLIPYKNDFSFVGNILNNILQ